MRVPDGVKAGEKRGAFLVLHGFGSNKDSSNVMAPTKVLTELGYVTLRFSMRGCGDSEGEFGRVICLEQVEDTRNALSFLAKHPAVDPNASRSSARASAARSPSIRAAPTSAWQR